MKKLLLTLIAVPFTSAVLFAQNFIIAGTVSDITTNAPVANHAVYIEADSSVFSYSNVVYTDANGGYSDIIPNGAQTGPNIVYYIYTQDCNSWQTVTVSNQQGAIQAATADFQICTGSSSGNVSCNSSFGYTTSGNTFVFYPFYNSTTASYFWSFGDGTNGSGVNPVHTYPVPGNYQVCLVVTDSASPCVTNTTCYNIYLNSSSCSAFFTWTVDTTNSTVFVMNNSANSAYSYFWNFGDGTTSNLAFPSHTYTNPGAYQICLTVADNNGCTATYCDSIVYIPFMGGQNRTGFTLNVINPVTLGTEEIKPVITSMMISPNPAEESIRLSFENLYTGNVNVFVTDVTGKTISSTNKNSVAGVNTVSLNVASFDAGIYFITVRDTETGSSVCMKFIKK